MSKWALLLGGSSGMGLASAHKLAKEGFNLVLIHRDRRSVLADFEKELDVIRTHGHDVFTFNVDGTSPEKIDELLPQFPEDIQFNLVLHAISRGNLKPFISADKPSLSTQDIALTMDAMAISVHRWISKLISTNRMAKNGRLITLTSAGSQRYWKGYGAVAMAKSALEIMTKYLAVELASFGLRVNAINAGITDTPSLRMIPGYEQLIEGASARNPLGRMTRPEDVANVIYLLTLPEADWITGTIIDVDGGEHLME